MKKTIQYIKSNILILLILLSSLTFGLESHFGFWNEQDIYDIEGNKVFKGPYMYDMGFEMDRYYTGKEYSQIWTREFFENYKSQLNFTEWKNNKELKITLGKTPDFFTPLTLNKTWFRWGYDRSGFDFSLGGAYYPWQDQRGLRIQLKNRNSLFKVLFHKTADDSDWDDRDRFSSYDLSRIYFEDNVDMDRYFLGLRYQTELGFMNMGFSFVNEHYYPINEKNNNFKGLFYGDVNNNAVKSLTLVIIDDSPFNDKYPASNLISEINDENGARIYNIDVYIDGTYNSNYDVNSGLPANDNYVTLNRITGIYDGSTHYYDNSVLDHYIEVSGLPDAGNEHYAFYKFDFSSNLNNYDLVNKIKFKIEISGDYRIYVIKNIEDKSVSKDDLSYPDPNVYRLVDRADGKGSAKKIIEYIYNENTGNTLWGIDMSGNIPFVNVGFNLDLAYNVRYGKYPNQDGLRLTDNDFAFTTEFTKRIWRILFVGRYFNIPYSYNADFAVEDNDDHDETPDVVDWDGVNFFISDKNNNNVYDWNEDFWLFKTDRGFHGQLDLNNNDIYDIEENDALPDYGFMSDISFYKLKRGQKGYQTLYKFDIDKDMESSGGYYFIEESKTTAKMSMLHNNLYYDFTFPFLTGQSVYEIKKVKDNIRDDIVTTYQDVQFINDKLIYRDSLVNNIRLNLQWKLVENLQFDNLMQLGYHKHYYSDITSLKDHEIVKVIYRSWFPFKNKVRMLSDWQIRPLYKLERINNVNIENVSYDRTNDENRLINSLALEFINQYTENTKLFFGIQYINQRDFLEIQYNESDIVSDQYKGNYYRVTYAVELNHNNKIDDRPFLIRIGTKYVEQVSKTGLNDINNIDVYVQSFFQW